jgi:hypothetical protein
MRNVVRFILWGAVCLSSTRCAVFGDEYAGGYHVTCPVMSEGELRQQVVNVSKTLSDQLGRPATVTFDDGSLLIMHIILIPFAGRGAPFESIQVSGMGRANDYGYLISLNKNGRNADLQSRSVQKAIEAAISMTPCRTWEFSVSHGNFAYQ